MLHVIVLARISPVKRNHLTGNRILEFNLLSSSGLHDQKNCFGNLFGKHFGADGNMQPCDSEVFLQTPKPEKFKDTKK